jgi:Branched-chain amino acid transport protein (AzlD)
MIWLVVAALFVGTVAIKAAGPLALGGRRPPERALHVIALVAPALLAGLVVYETFTADGQGIEIDARVVGLAAASMAAAARLPLLVIVLIAALATALARAVR